MTGPDTSPHCQQCGFAWRHPMFYVMLDGFDHDDGIIDHQTYGQDQAEERKRVNREAEQREENKRSNQ